MKILAISGSARAASTNTALLYTMKNIAPDGVQLHIVHNLNALPVFSPDTEGERTPVVVREFLDEVLVSDGIIISSPEYVRTIPGGLKNAIDWMVSRFEIVGKPIALVHASHRGDDMLASLRLVLSTVSSHFLESLFLRIPLIGKSPQEVQELLSQPEHKSQITTFLNNFLTAHKIIVSEPDIAVERDAPPKSAAPRCSP
ncbi:MAG: NAD(P)H-dependent oxidoreductase [Gammaproteobacteria bacterium]|nr:NAD(P)H-dependent oxidoreductase [Gammaproteobacteria bacterium]MCW8988577.1 NAD(P)H-dependent oxidoreductase [Gammaproteobacteria bacterium]MCW9030377.1 NAD(P)H-dependent oxidoreductase [Gammaproteobacteria bacterium]